MNEETIYMVNISNELNIDCEFEQNVEKFNNVKNNIDLNNLYFLVNNDGIGELFSSEQFIDYGGAYYDENIGLFVNKNDCTALTPKEFVNRINEDYSLGNSQYYYRKNLTTVLFDYAKKIFEKDKCDIADAQLMILKRK